MLPNSTRLGLTGKQQLLNTWGEDNSGAQYVIIQHQVNTCCLLILVITLEQANLKSACVTL